MLTEDQVRQALMRGAVALRLSGPGVDPLTVPLMIAGQEMFTENPNLRRSEAREAVFLLRDSHRAKFSDPAAEALKSDYQRWMDIFEVAHSLPGENGAVRFLAGAVRKVFERMGGTEVDLAARGLNALAASEQGYAYWSSTHNVVAETIDRALLMSSVTDADVPVYPEYAAFWNEIHGVDWNLDIEASTAALLEDPRLATLHGVAQLRDETGGIRRDIAAVLAQTEAAGGALSTLLGITQEVRQEGLASARSTAALQERFIDYVKAEDDRRRRQAEEHAAAEERQLRLAAVTAGASVLGALVGLVDPVLGRRVEGVVRAGVQAAETISTFAQSAAKLGAAGVGMAGAVLTGNLLGAAMGVVSLFADEGPPPTTLILRGIDALRVDLNDFRSAVADRFDRVDSTLNTILETTVDGLARVDLKLARLTTTVDALDRRFIEVQARLGRFEGAVVELIRDVARQDLEHHLTRIGHERTYGVPLSYEAYVDAAGGLHRWAVLEARKSFAVGASNRSLAPNEVHVELSRGSLAENLNYVSDLLTARWGLGFRLGTTPLPNPADWALARNAYSQLMEESPAHARQVNKAQTEEIDAVGQELVDALARIARLPAEDGGTAMNRDLFRRLHEDYLSSAAALQAGIKAKLRAYEEERGFLPFRGRDQDPWNSYQPNAPTPSLPETIPLTELSIGLHLPPPTPADTRDLPLPPFTPREAFPAIILMAHRVARARSLSIFADFTFEANAFWSPFSYGPAYHQVGPNGNKNDMTVRLVVTVTASVGSEDYLQAKFVATQDEPLQHPMAGTNKNMYKKVNETVVERWTELAPVLARSALLLPNLISLPEFVRRSLPTEGAGLYAEIAEHLRTGELKHLADILTGAADLWGSVLELGLPALVGRDEYVRALVHGDELRDSSPADAVARAGGEALLTGAGVAAWFDAASARLRAQVAASEYDAIVAYRDCDAGPFSDAVDRAAVLAERVEAHLGLLERSGATDEQPSLRAALLGARAADLNVQASG